MLGPMADISAIASKIPGNAIMPSITRITGVSRRRKYPAVSPTHVPLSVVRSATRKPISNERREPHTVRLNTSRPKLSVPNRCICPGGIKRPRGFSAMGSVRASHGASSAMPRTMTRSVPPMGMPLFLSSRRVRRWCQARDGRPAASAWSVSRRWCCCLITVAYPRIDHGIGQVYQEIDAHIHGGDDQQDALYQRIIPPCHTLNKQTADARNVKNLLRDHCPAKEQGKTQAHGRDQGNNGIAQGMPKEHPGLCYTLGACCANVVLR